MARDAKPRVLIVGAGGIGVPAAWTLAQSGAVDITIIDPDAIELSNLPRQIIYSDLDIGRMKATAARDRIREQFASVQIESRQIESRIVALDSSNADELIRGHGVVDVVIDATDSPEAKFELNDACIRARTAFVYAGVVGTSGQLMTVLPGRSACIRCAFETAPETDEAATCSNAGIVGPVAGFIGIAAAHEAITIAGGRIGDLVGRMLIYRAGIYPRVRRISIEPRAGCICGAATEAQVGA